MAPWLEWGRGQVLNETVAQGQLTGPGAPGCQVSPGRHCPGPRCNRGWMSSLSGRPCPLVIKLIFQYKFSKASPAPAQPSQHQGVSCGHKCGFVFPAPPPQWGWSPPGPSCMEGARLPASELGLGFSLSSPGRSQGEGSAALTALASTPPFDFGRTAPYYVIKMFLRIKNKSIIFSV